MTDAKNPITTLDEFLRQLVLVVDGHIMAAKDAEKAFSEGMDRLAADAADLLIAQRAACDAIITAEMVRMRQAVE